MARTADLVADSDILASHTHLTFQAGKISYEVATSEDRNTYMVTDGTRRISAPLTWSFGDGHVGQSWLIEQAAKFYES
jgi:hypothetical protein